MRELDIVSWNIGGIAGYLDEGKHEPLTDVVETLGRPDVLCLQEVQLRPVDEKALDVLDGYAVAASLNRDPKNGGFRGGRSYGVVTYVREDLFEGGRTFAWDLEGRAVVTNIGDLVVANVYAVNGTDRPHFDHERGAHHGDRHAWKRRFIDLLAGQLAHERGHLVAIGDWNVSRAAIDITPRLRTEEPHATARRTFDETFVRGLDLVDVFRQAHPEARRYTWFNVRAERWGRLDAARVDYALVARALTERVKATEVLDPRFGSDHAPIRIRMGMRTASRPA